MAEGQDLRPLFRAKFSRRRGAHGLRAGIGLQHLAGCPAWVGTPTQAPWYAGAPKPGTPLTRLLDQLYRYLAIEGTDQPS
jgi:hypothetical protein